MRKKNQRQKPPADPGPGPETRLSPRFESSGIAQLPIALPDEMHLRALDDLKEELR